METTRSGTLDVAFVKSNPYLVKPEPEPEPEAKDPGYIKAQDMLVTCFGGAAIVLAAAFVYLI
ncbi:MAG: hypothetical protein ACRDBO_06120 [Lachnospiraceae bacterium]